MTEEDEKKKEPKIKIIDGLPCYDLEPNSIIEKKKIQNKSANHPFTFGWLQETKERQFMPDVLKEIEKIFDFPIVPGRWKVYELIDGELKELKEDEEDDNSE